QAEYAAVVLAVVLLVAPLVTAIFAFGPPADVRTLYAEGLCRITEEANCDEDGNPGEPPGAVPSPQPSPGEGTGRNPMRRARTLRRTKRKPMKYVQAGKDEGRGTYLFDPRPYLDRLPDLLPELPEGARSYASRAGHYDFYAPDCVKDLLLVRVDLPEEGEIDLRLRFAPNPFKHD